MYCFDHIDELKQFLQLVSTTHYYIGYYIGTLLHCNTLTLILELKIKLLKNYLELPNNTSGKMHLILPFA